jgi:hypothetical protein
MSRIVFDPPRGWQRARWRIAIGASMVLAALGAWWAGSMPLEPEPSAPRTAAVPPATTAQDFAPTRTRDMNIAPSVSPPQAAASAAIAPAPATPLSTMVAPGVHVTPLSAPPGATPVPAGARAHDSESEN